MASEELFYQGYLLRVRNQGRGWVVLIHPPGPGGTLALDPIPYNLDRDVAIAEAKQMVDAHLAS